jgi:hypothetical protein
MLLIGKSSNKNHGFLQSQAIESNLGHAAPDTTVPLSAQAPGTGRSSWLNDTLWLCQQFAIEHGPYIR